MRILVTGAQGFAGAHLLAELTKSGEHRVAAGALVGTLSPDGGQAGGPVEWFPLDVTDLDSVRAVVRELRPEQIYHLAGQASVGESFRSPLPTWEVNATGTLVVLEALRQEGLGESRLLLISSAEVYGAVPPEQQPITESQPLRPLTPYGSSKAAAEVIAAQYARAGMVDVVIARSFNQIGPGQDERFVLPSFARQLASMRQGAAEPVLHVGNLDVRRDFLDVRDGVRGYVHIMERGETGEAYNVASGAARSLDEVVRRLVTHAGVPARLEVDEDRVRPVDIPELIGDAGRLRALGWAPTHEMDDTLRDLFHHAAARVQANG